MPDFGLLKGREHYTSVQNPDGIYVELISSLNDLCAKLSVSEYVIATGKERSVFRVRMPDGSEQRHERPVTNYYELIAVLNFCVTISYYAIVSENRSEEGSIIWKAEKLKEELNLLGHEVQDEVDEFQKLSSHLIFFPQPLAEVIALDE
jgi:hypothetical protein